MVVHISGDRDAVPSAEGAKSGRQTTDRGTDDVGARASPRIVLVLGGGSILGGSYHAGVLRAMQTTLGIDSGSVHAIVGTSSGATTAAFLGGGLDAEALYRRELGEPIGRVAAAKLAEAGRALSAPSVPWPRLPIDRATFATPGPAAPLVALQAASRWLPVSLGAVVAGLLPRGTQPLSPVRRYFNTLMHRSWPSGPQLLFCSVDLATGQRVVFDSTSGISIGRAVSASCSLPAVHRPVSFGGREYVDGAVHSMNNADVAVGLAPDLVVVSAPLWTSERLSRPRFHGRLRNSVRAQTRWETGRVERIAPIVVIEPTPDLTRAMGFDLGAHKHRSTIARLTYEMACGQLKAAQPRVAAAAAMATPVSPLGNQGWPPSAAGCSDRRSLLRS